MTAVLRQLNIPLLHDFSPISWLLFTLFLSYLMTLLYMISPLLKTEWKTLQFMAEEELACGVKCTFLQATERSDPEDTSLFEPDETHAYVGQVLVGRCSPESVERVESTDIRFQQTLSHLLLYTRIFSFS